MNNIEMEKIVKSTFGGLLYEIRSEYEISQEVMAVICRISCRQYANLENGRCVPTVLNFINILKIFDVKIDDFVDKLIANGYVIPDMDPNREMDIVNI